jgi:hypothetical protein
MHEDNLHSTRNEVRLNLRDVVDRLTAKRTSEVPQKNQ